jgi:secreted Zn-dependent insulinase-like peptidase
MCIFNENTYLSVCLFYRLFHLVDSPLLLDSVVRDEISIVNSEFVKYFPDDYKRYDQIQLATARLGHPYRIFTTG